MAAFYVRIAGILGAAAVAAGAYGSHGLPSRLKKLGLSDADQEVRRRVALASEGRPRALSRPQRNKLIWRTGNVFHLVHSVALLATPMMPASQLAAPLLALGVVLFSGSVYARAFTDVREFGMLGPVGGILLIAGWLVIAMYA